MGAPLFYNNISTSGEEKQNMVIHAEAKVVFAIS